MSAVHEKSSPPRIKQFQADTSSSITKPYQKLHNSSSEFSSFVHPSNMEMSLTSSSGSHNSFSETIPQLPTPVDLNTANDSSNSSMAETSASKNKVLGFTGASMSVDHHRDYNKALLHQRPGLSRCPLLLPNSNCDSREGQLQIDETKGNTVRLLTQDTNYRSINCYRSNTGRSNHDKTPSSVGYTTSNSAFGYEPDLMMNSRVECPSADVTGQLRHLMHSSSPMRLDHDNIRNSSHTRDVYCYNSGDPRRDFGPNMKIDEKETKKAERIQEIVQYV